jgi:hypothetical protein
MASGTMKRVWAQAACFDEMFSLLAKEIWIYFCEIRHCAQSRDSLGEQFLKTSQVQICV